MCTPVTLGYFRGIFSLSRHHRSPPNSTIPHPILKILTSNNTQMTRIKKNKLPQGLNRAIAWKQKHPEDSIAKVVEYLFVNSDTLSRRLRGVQRSHAEAREKQQLLTKSEEEALVKWALTMSDLGFPVHLAMLRAMAVHILQFPETAFFNQCEIYSISRAHTHGTED
ncbi:hypothetical protein BDZ91DRAFT_816025 [Kalaharituber pfeilii]|nr:hypothetical protein BDZ91DRAFT_816025 [Kalaharituber pfeilii]